MTNDNLAFSPAFRADDWREILADGADVASPHQTMALANASLPDDDPRKITRADVAALRDVLGTCRDDAPDYNGDLASLDIARAVCAKLAAILPPE